MAETSQASASSPWKIVLGILACLYVGLSVLNEFASTPLYNLGLASFTHPVHATLGFFGLLYLITGYKPGKAFLIVWLVTAIPVVAFDVSKHLVTSLIQLGVVSENSSSVRFSYNLPRLTRYSSIGVNFSPILLAAALWGLHRWGAIPLSKSEHARQIGKRLAIAGMVAFAVGAALIGLFVAWLVSAPRVLLPSEPGIEYYFEDQKLSSGLLRFTPRLMQELGLDQSTPPSEWDIRRGDPYPYARGIFVKRKLDY